MIFIYHNHRKVVSVESQNKNLTFDSGLSVAKIVTNLAKQFPNEILVWCHQDCKDFLNKNNLESLLHHQKMMLSFCPNGNYFGKNIGYVEDSPFIKVNKKVRYPTWQMSSCVGAIPSKVILQFESISTDTGFDYYLNSIAKLGLPQGLFCYSEPKLFKKNGYVSKNESSYLELFIFVKQHYKTRWLLLLFLNLYWYKNQFLLFSFLSSIFFYKRKIKIKKLQFESIPNHDKTEKSFDVIIPTIGRKTYLLDFLNDLNLQSHLPKNVIIVEQNPIENSVSELDCITTEKWNFKIKHTFTHQAGACNARNIALNQVESNWVFLADDDIRIQPNFVENVFSQINKFNAKAVTIRCHLKNEPLVYDAVFQWNTFGTGSSFVNAEVIKDIKFNMGFEFGFGEDTDFGMQIRNLGIDVLYFPKPEILHLKAPIGGFRTKPILKWQNDSVQPKPSPTVMLYKLKHDTVEQISGYKTTLFFKFYKHQNIKNPVLYFKNFKKQWNQSVFWANELKKIA